MSDVVATMLDNLYGKYGAENVEKAIDECLADKTDNEDVSIQDVINKLEAKNDR